MNFFFAPAEASVIHNSHCPLLDERLQ